MISGSGHFAGALTAHVAKSANASKLHLQSGGGACLVNGFTAGGWGAPCKSTPTHPYAYLALIYLAFICLAVLLFASYLLV